MEKGDTLPRRPWVGARTVARVRDGFKLWPMEYSGQQILLKIPHAGIMTL